MFSFSLPVFVMVKLAVVEIPVMAVIGVVFTVRFWSGWMFTQKVWR